MTRLQINHSAIACHVFSFSVDITPFVRPLYVTTMILRTRTELTLLNTIHQASLSAELSNLSNPPSLQAAGFAGPAVDHATTATRQCSGNDPRSTQKWLPVTGSSLSRPASPNQAAKSATL